MLSTWSNLQNKENSIVLQPSKVRAAVPGKNSKLENMPKKKVFGDVGNTIRAFDNKRENLGGLKTPAKPATKFTIHEAPREEVWPEPEFLPPCTTFEDNYEDCWPLHLRLSKRCVRELGDYRGKGKKPMPTSIEDSPLPLGRFHEEGRVIS
ncbi:hypothetical protein J437_LFUL005641 [Ladona fulva]|uniref:Uncharacterized protein n=1 Tax=Ladona fulva TaxID=123851 RepID=A0A8K0NYX9_LADFU|nr:hypothetical protein J437_LFUL005641 [Ladona fulva]